MRHRAVLSYDAKAEDPHRTGRERPNVRSREMSHTSPTWRLSQAALTVFWFTKTTWEMEPDTRSETATGDLEVQYGMD